MDWAYEFLPVVMTVEFFQCSIFRNNCHNQMSASFMAFPNPSRHDMKNVGKWRG